MRFGPGLALSLLLASTGAMGEPILPADYDSLQKELTRRIDFERLPRQPEPGIALDLPVYGDGAWLGERFAGQRQVAPSGHDIIEGAPSGPALRIAAGAVGRNLSVAHHRGFGSNAVFPVGPAGFPALEARGEGALAILFDDDQAAMGFKLHADYPDPLGRRLNGEVEVRFFARNGALIAVHRHATMPGVLAFGYRRGDKAPGIAGVLILNTDPGGIALDDIIFAKPPLLG